MEPPEPQGRPVYSKNRNEINWMERGRGVRAGRAASAFAAPAWRPSCALPAHRPAREQHALRELLEARRSLGVEAAARRRARSAPSRSGPKRTRRAAHRMPEHLIARRIWRLRPSCSTSVKALVSPRAIERAAPTRAGAVRPSSSTMPAREPAERFSARAPRARPPRTRARSRATGAASACASSAVVGEQQQALACRGRAARPGTRARVLRRAADRAPSAGLPDRASSSRTPRGLCSDPVDACARRERLAVERRLRRASGSARSPSCADAPFTRTRPARISASALRRERDPRGREELLEPRARCGCGRRRSLGAVRARRRRAASRPASDRWTTAARRRARRSDAAVLRLRAELLDLAQRRQIGERREPEDLEEARASSRRAIGRPGTSRWPGDRAPVALEQAAQHRARVDAAHVLDLGARHRLPVGDDRERLERRARDPQRRALLDLAHERRELRQRAQLEAAGRPPRSRKPRRLRRVLLVQLVARSRAPATALQRGTHLGEPRRRASAPATRGSAPRRCAAARAAIASLQWLPHAAPSHQVRDALPPGAIAARRAAQPDRSLGHAVRRRGPGRAERLRAARARGSRGRWRPASAREIGALPSQSSSVELAATRALSSASITAIMRSRTVMRLDLDLVRHARSAPARSSAAGSASTSCEQMPTSISRSASAPARARPRLRREDVAAEQRARRRARRPPP